MIAAVAAWLYGYSSTIGDASLCSDRPASTRANSHKITVLSPEWRTMWIIYLSLNQKYSVEMGEALLESKSYTRLIHLASCSRKPSLRHCTKLSLTRCAKLVRVLVMQVCLLINFCLQKAHVKWCPRCY